MKIFLSCDIEGTNGICAWEETENGPLYDYFAKKMTEEVSSVCKGINKLDSNSEIFVKDAHETARNIDHQRLPENTMLCRGWSSTPYSMMYGIDSSFDAAIFTGYHSGAGYDGNPLAHTMNANDIIYIKINGVLASEFLINYYTSLYNGVPVVMVSGDEHLCNTIKEIDPNIYTVPASKGTGDSTTSPHPNITLKKLEETALEAIKNRDKVKTDLPSEFKTEIRFKDHNRAERGSFYPSAFKIDAYTVGFNTDDYFEFLRFLMLAR